MKNLERIKSYKLMMATNTGVVKEICEGKYTRFKVMACGPTPSTSSASRPSSGTAHSFGLTPSRSGQSEAKKHITLSRPIKKNEVH